MRWQRCNKENGEALVLDANRRIGLRDAGARSAPYIETLGLA